MLPAKNWPLPLVKQFNALTNEKYQKDIISNGIHRVIYFLYQLQHKYITYLTSTERRLESLENQMKKVFTKAIGKADGINIVLLYKPGGDLVGKYYYTKKN